MYFQFDTATNDYVGTGYNIRSANIVGDRVFIDTDIQWNSHRNFDQFLIRNLETDQYYGVDLSGNDAGLWTNVTPRAHAHSRDTLRNHLNVISRDSLLPKHWFNSFTRSSTSVKLGDVTRVSNSSVREIQVTGLSSLLRSGDFEVSLSPTCLNDSIVILAMRPRYDIPDHPPVKQTPEASSITALLVFGAIMIWCRKKAKSIMK